MVKKRWTLVITSAVKMANGRKYPTPQGISFKFNEWNEFIKVAQKCIQNIQKYIPVNPVFWMKIDQGMMLIHVRSAKQRCGNLLQG